MAVRNRQIGWSPMSNALYDVLREFNALKGQLAGPPAPTTTSTTVDPITCISGWSIVNLDVTTYANGDPIPEVTDPGAWTGLTTGAWCHYNNDPANSLIYGRLYNWYAVNDPRGLAPTGYHIPTDVEFQTLIDCLGGGVFQGDKLKEAGTAHWDSPNTGNNLSGFTALPAGNRYGVDGLFYDINKSAIFWTVTPSDPYSKGLIVTGLSNYLALDIYNRNSGLSVRVIQN